MSQTISIALCGVAAPAAEQFAAWLEEHPALGLSVTAAVPDTDGLLERLAEEPVHGIVLDAGLGLEGLSFAQELQAAGYTAICLIGPESPIMRRRVGELGIASCPSRDPARLASILRQLLGLAEGQAAEGRIIAFHSPRGGAGTSSLLLHAARTLTSRGCTVAVVEVNGTGGVLPLFGLRPTGGWAELWPYLAEDLAGQPEGPALVGRALVEAEPGLHLLPSGGPTLMDDVQADQLETVLQLLGTCGYAYILVDTPAELTLLTGAALLAADAICLVGLPEPVSAYRLVQVAGVLTELQVDSGRVHPVINRVKESLPPRVSEVLQFLPFRPALRVPDEAKPAVDGAGLFIGFRSGSPAAKAMDRLLEQLAMEVNDR